MIQKILGQRAGVDYALKNKTAKLLSGDPGAVKTSISISESLGHKQTFCSGILSWKKGEEPTEKQIEEVIQSHRKLIEAGIPEGSAKLVYVSHSDKNHFHIHWTCSEEIGGKKFSPYFARTDFNFFNDWKELENAKNGWTNPERPPYEDRIELLRSPKNVSLEVFREFEALKVESGIVFENGLLKNRDDFFEWLKQSGFEPRLEKKIGQKGKSKGKELRSISIQNCDNERRTLRGLLSYESNYPSPNERGERKLRLEEKRRIESNDPNRVQKLSEEYDRKLKIRAGLQQKKYGQRIEKALGIDSKKPKLFDIVAEKFKAFSNHFSLGVRGQLRSFVSHDLDPSFSKPSPATDGNKISGVATKVRDQKTFRIGGDLLANPENVTPKKDIFAGMTNSYFKAKDAIETITNPAQKIVSEATKKVVSEVVSKVAAASPTIAAAVPIVGTALAIYGAVKVTEKVFEDTDLENRKKVMETLEALESKIDSETLQQTEKRLDKERQKNFPHLPQKKKGKKDNEPQM